MSLPFAGAPSDDGQIRVLQLCRLDDKEPWRPLTKPIWTTQITLSTHYIALVDTFKDGTKIVYARSGHKVPVSYISPYQADREVGKVDPIVGVMACDKVEVGLDGLIPTLSSVELMFHIGDNVFADALCTPTTKDGVDIGDALAKLYIKTWARLPMNTMEHRLIPDDNDFASDGLISQCRTHMAYLKQATKFNDLLGLAINGAQREKEHYYTALFETATTQYLAISNWVPNNAGVPQFVNNERICQDLKALKVAKGKGIVLMVSRCGFALIQSVATNRVFCENEYSWNYNNYAAFGDLKQYWMEHAGIKDLTVICGDIHIPVSYDVAYTVKTGKDTHRIIRYKMYSTGTFSNLVEPHNEGDFVLSKKVPVTLKPIYHTAHLSHGNSYLQLQRDRVYRIFKDQDIMYSTGTSIKYLLNGALNLPF
ncbi:Hypothetical protein POVN_LOCUS311 [uncultured virus]|nr:Hypothetical protein POVN_LOCUS311 [uncultured virus]